MASFVGRSRIGWARFVVCCLGALVASTWNTGSVQGQGVQAEVSVRRSATTGLATWVRPSATRTIEVTPAAGQTEIRPLDFFNQYGELFGVTDAPSQLRQVASHVGLLGQTHTSYEQIHRGIPVFSGLLKVHQDATGQVLAANGDFYPISSRLRIIPSISELAAQDTAMGSVDWADAQVHSVELVIVDPGWYGDPAFGARLAYHLVITDTAGYRTDGIFVEAHNGEVMDQWSMICTAKDRQIRDALGGPSIGAVSRAEGEDPVASDVVNAAYDFVGDTYDYYFNAFGRDSIDDAGMTMVATVNFFVDGICPNAFWSGIIQQIVFCNEFVIDDVIAHEVTHGVTEHTANLIYQNESGQLNEAYSDIFGEMVDLYNGGAAVAGTPDPGLWTVEVDRVTDRGTDTPNDLREPGVSPLLCTTSSNSYQKGVRWILGEDFNGNTLRDMWEPVCLFDPDQVVSTRHKCGTDEFPDNGGVHSGSGIANHAFAIMTDGKTFNGQTVSAIGPIKAGAVWYRALTVYLTPGSDYQDAYEALNQAAQDLIGDSPNDPYTGAASASAFTSGDATMVDRALKAVEMHLAGPCGRSAEILEPPETVTQCPNRTIIFEDDFESGPGTWVLSTTGPNGPPTLYDWEQTSESLPFGREGTVWFIADANIGDCAGQNETALHSLISPDIQIPANAEVPVLAFTHYLATEGGFDGGNLSVSAGGGGFQTVPRSAFRYSPYNHVIHPGSGNSLAGLDVFSGAGGGWGTSIVDLSGLVDPGQSLLIRFDFGKDCLGGADGWYLDDVQVYDCPDCDNDGTANHYEDVIFAASQIFTDFNDTREATLELTSPPLAASGVELRFHAIGDLNLSTEKLDVFLNDISVGSVFESGASDCAFTPNTDSLTISASSFNAKVDGGNATIRVVPRSGVTADLCENGSSISIDLRYTRTDTDCNTNGIPDACDIDDGTSQDCDSDGRPDICDSSLDCDTDGIIDACESSTDQQDCDGDGECNAAQIAGCGGQAECLDVNNNGLPDGCDECVGASDCDDNLFCNGVETCAVDVCQAGNNPCPGRMCDEASGSCVDCLTSSECDNGLICDGGEFCSDGTCMPGFNPCEGLGFCDEDDPGCYECVLDSHCPDDGLFCTDAPVCENHACGLGSSPCLADCDDDNDVCLCTENVDCADDTVFCNGVEICQDGVCVSDGDPCPGQICDEEGGTCIDCLVDDDCQDDVFCNGTESCEEGSCESSGDPCPGSTACDVALDICDCNTNGISDSIDIATNFSDDCNFNTNPDECDLRDCAGEPVCDDCNTNGALDFCELAGNDVNTNNVLDQCDEWILDDAECLGGPVDNGFCAGRPLCVSGECVPGLVPCAPEPTEYCDEQGEACLACLLDDHCDDGKFCNGSETCVAGACQLGADPCPDHDECNDLTDMCIDCVADDRCDDLLFCNGVETCQGGFCVDGEKPCAASFGCDETEKVCTTCNVNADCDNGVFCDGPETCDDGNCFPGNDPCPGQNCDETRDSCGAPPPPPPTQCASQADCDDGDFCNGEESCAGGNCQAGDDPCPDQQCVNDTCVDCVIDSDCDDDNFCNGAETCTAQNECQDGQLPCVSLDACDEDNDTCPCVGDADCDDGVFCNGPESCEAGGCTAGAAPCTDLMCLESSASCVACVAHADCDDGIFCNGSELCVSSQCLGGDLPCVAGQCCNEGQDSCGTCPCDTVADCDDGDDCTADACDAGQCRYQSIARCGDNDGDGVADEDDDCPDTAPGVEVDAEGCSCAQLDDDADGVSNCDDTCPGSPAGGSVDNQGCLCSERDDDGDGVDNCDDLCPATAIGVVVAGDGCAPAQLDADADGVIDAIDTCPNTPLGEIPDTQGCSLTQRQAGDGPAGAPIGDTDGDNQGTGRGISSGSGLCGFLGMIQLVILACGMGLLRKRRRR